MPTPPPSVVLVTCAVLPEPDHDQEPLLGALRARGIDARMLAWDEEGSASAPFDRAVLRSTWNYYLVPERFRAWIDAPSLAGRLLNPPAAVRWNLHKSYLAELERAGLPVVPTLHAERGRPLELPAELARRGWGDVVVKPAISAASWRTRRFAPGAAGAQRFLDELLVDGDALVQPFVASVEESGERALVWIEGELTHAVRKATRYAGEEEGVSGALEPEPDEREVAGQTMDVVRAAVDVPLLYARVDLMRAADGSPLVSEVELVEPSLFLVQSPRALERLVDAIEAHVV